MALFPDASFKVLVPQSGVIPGTRAEGMLVLTVPEAIPRADHVDLFFRTVCVAGYGSGKNRSVHRRDVFVSPLKVDLDRSRPLAAGTYQFPFAVDVPPWLPPAYIGNDCSIQHLIEVRLDVDWAVDPKATVTPVVVLPPAEASGHPVITRSPPGFHESIVVDLTLDTSCIALGDQLTGQIALRSGHAARFDAVTVSIASMARITMARGDRRRGRGATVRIPADALRSGQGVPFAFPTPAGVPPTFQNGFIDHEVVVLVEVDIPWALDPSFELPLHVVPAGSRVHRDAQGTAPVGAERLSRLAAAMSQATGLAQAPLPALLDGNVGPVRVHVADGPREGRIGLETSFEFPDVALGTVLRPLGMLGGFRQSPLLPANLNEGYLLRVDTAGALATPVPDEALRAFFGAVLGDLGNAGEIRLSDHHLGLHFPLANDGSDVMVKAAQWVKARAETIAAAIARLPFPAPLASARAAWEATAGEQSAFLVPHVPAIHGLVLSSRVVGGEQRAIGAAIRTRADGTITVDLDLRGTPLPRPAWAEIEKGAEVPGLRAVRAVFPRIDVQVGEKVALEGAAWTPDPRVLLSTIEVFFWWLLESRGERRADAPYR